MTPSSSRTPPTTTTRTTTTTTTSNPPGENTEHMVVSVVYSNGVIGASYYTQAFLDVRMTPQLPDQGCNLQQLQLLLQKLQPSTIIISRTAHRDLANSVNAFVALHRSSRVEKVPPQQMQLGIAKQELMSSNIQGRPGTPFSDCSEDDKLIFLNSILDFSQEISLRSMGALLQHVKSHFQNSDAVVIATLGMHRGCGHLSVPSRTLRDLHILAEEAHPCAWQGDSRRAREGISVYSLFERNCSIGRVRLKSLFCAPYNDVRQIEQSLSSIEYLLDQECLAKSLHQNLARIKRIDRILVNMCQGQTTVPEWQVLRDTCHHLLVVQGLLSAAPNSSLCGAIERAREASYRDTSSILHMIERTIDFEAFKENPSYTSPVKAGICDYLDEKKKQLFGNIHKRLTELTLTEMTNLPADVSDGRIIYLPCWGFVFATRLENVGTMRQLQSVEHVCKMDTEAFFKTSITRDLDKQYGDLRNIIIHRENRICRTLQIEVIERSWQLLKIIDKLCHLDAVLALAITARERGFKRPKIIPRNRIIVKNGYHPLLEFHKAPGASHIIPNSYLSTESVPVNIVTGANSCGKSVYLRQNALIVYLAHVGSFVPAEDSRICLLDTIQTSFFIDETMRDQASSFALQCRQIASVERSVESVRALVVIDEFGKGTNTAEGAALCVALVEKFMEWSNSPHVILASHYYKHLYYFLKHRPKVEFLTFRYVIEGNNLVQLHRVVDGVSVKSFGSFAAREADLPQEVIATQERISAFGLDNVGDSGSSTYECDRDFHNFALQALDEVRLAIRDGRF
ncbi:mutS protein homolog 5-like [Galendromus occidentalis]|uniref:MutS protein homolog 5-like n=1 Tax=Galendromus occidentalis TaxID=34638 RepID=A0AAJ6QRT2_9ACAR|nr:mutS protein homolog 5-like [Galendromus occidentalis]